MENEIQLSSQKSQQNYQSDEIDLLRLIMDIVEHWKSLFLSVIIGALISFLLASTIPTKYKVVAHIALPNEGDVAVINNNSLINLNAQQLFTRYLDTLNASNNFTEFLLSSGTISALYPESELTDTILAVNLGEELSFQNFTRTDEPGEATAFKVSISLTHSKEKEIVAIINEYLSFTSEKLLDDLKAQSQTLKMSKINQLKQQLAVLRESAKAERLMEIERIEQRNALELRKLSQQIEVMVEKAKEDRLVEIATIEAKNEIAIQRLNQRYQLLVEKSKKDRETQIAEAKDALKVAQRLNIKLPTPVTEFREAREGDNSTNINLTENTTLPLYLMGTEFLVALIDSLVNRTNDEVYVKELSEISMEIQRLKDDKRLERLKNQTEDYSLLSDIPEIKRKMALLKNDKDLEFLKERESDDLYIEDLPRILADIRKLEQQPMVLESVEPIRITKSAFATGIPIKTNRNLIIVLGILISVLVALIVVLVGAGIKRRRLN